MDESICPFAAGGKQELLPRRKERLKTDHLYRKERQGY
jgi:hypothetical protein